MNSTHTVFRSKSASSFSVLKLFFPLVYQFITRFTLFYCNFLSHDYVLIHSLVLLLFYSILLLKSQPFSSMCVQGKKKSGNIFYLTTMNVFIQVEVELLYIYQK